MGGVEMLTRTNGQARSLAIPIRFIVALLEALTVAVWATGGVGAAARNNSAPTSLSLVGKTGAYAPMITCTPTNYTMSQSTGTFVSGSADVGNHTDDGMTTVSLPFAYTLYDQS